MVLNQNDAVLRCSEEVSSPKRGGAMSCKEASSSRLALLRFYLLVVSFPWFHGITAILMQVAVYILINASRVAALVSR